MKKEVIHHRQKKKIMCVYCHMLKKIRVGWLEIYIFLNFIFYSWIVVGATVTVHQFFCILHFCHTCSLCRVELVVQFPARGSTQVLLYLFPGVLWLWYFLYNVSPHPVSSLHIYTFVVSRAFMAGAASQAGNADSSRAPGLTSGLQGSVNVHRGALLLVPQWQCISSFVFYIGWH